MLPRLQTVAILTLLFLAPSVRSKPTESEKPNIIFIMADDLGAEALACYGNDLNKTPNLDRLAKEGMRFTHAYATPLCTPTRAQVMTGKYNNRNYIGFGLFDKNEKTFADYMKQAGYVTGITGKWQLLGNDKQKKLAGGKTGALPTEVGFDHYCLWQVDELGSRYKDPTITTDAGTTTIKGAYGPDLFTSYSLGFIEKNRERPFFLYYPMVLTHSPYEPTPDSPDYGAERKKGAKQTAYFKPMVEYMDKQVGRIVDQVEKLGLDSKTLIIFTGDNGTGKEVTSQVNGQPIQGGKGTTTRYGTNVPLIAYWAGAIKPGQTNENLIDFTDFLPTFLEVAAITAPAGAKLDGLSFRKQLINNETPVREWIFCHYNPRWYSDFKAVWAHTKKWKLYSDGRFFNIENDPLEKSPATGDQLSAEDIAVKSKLEDVIKSHLQPGD